MANLTFPINEPVFQYQPNSVEIVALKDELKRQLANSIDIPAIINGKEVRTGKTDKMIVPHNHRHVLGHYHQVTEREVSQAIEGGLTAWKTWSSEASASRAAIFLRAAELLKTKYRPILNAATMLGQSKTCYQAEIDSACELIDFWKFNVHFQKKIERVKPISIDGIQN